MTTKNRKFRKGTPVLVLVHKDDGRFDVVEATYEFPSLSGSYHQARKPDGTIIQCHANDITKAA